MKRAHRLAVVFFVAIGAAPVAGSAQESTASAPSAPAPAQPLQLAPVSTTKIEMPDDACRQRLSGWVDLDFVVLPDGKVTNIAVAGSQPQGVFDSAAVESLSEWVYPPQQAPVKVRQRLPMTWADCRSAQLRDVAAPTDAAPQSPENCPALAAEAKVLGERFTVEDSARAVRTGEDAQIYSGPGPHCIVKGKTFKSTHALKAYVEHKGFSLVSRPKASEESAVWVRSNQLRDLGPP